MDKINSSPDFVSLNANDNSTSRAWLHAAGFFLLAVLVLSVGIDRGLIFDEYKTKMVAFGTWDELLRDRLSAGHLPTFFAMTKAWLGLVPYSNWQMRVPSALFAALGVFPFYFLGRRIAGPSAGAWTALFYIFNQTVIWSGQAARPYGPMLFFQGLTVLSAVQWWGSRRLGWLALAGVASLGGLVMMPLAGLTTLALVLGVIATWRLHNTARAWPLIGVLVSSMAIGFLPAVLVGGSQEKLTVDRGWSFPKFDNVLEALPTMTIGDYSIWARGIMEYVGLLLFLTALFFAFRRWPVLRRGRTGDQTGEAPAEMMPRTADPATSGADVPWRIWVLFWILVPLVALIFVTAFTGRGMVTHSRYQTPAIGGVFLLAGVGLARFRAAGLFRPFRDGITVLVLLPTVLTGIAWMRSPGEGVAPVVRAMIDHSGGRVPDRVAGNIRWLRMDLPPGEIPAREFFLERQSPELNDILVDAARVRGSDVRTMVYQKTAKDITNLQHELGDWAAGEPFWLFVYIQDREEALDRLAEDPPAGYRMVRKAHKGYARAYQFEPVRD